MKTKLSFSTHYKITIVFIVLQILSFNNIIWGQVGMSTSGYINQNFNTLSSSNGTWTDNYSIPNWYWQEYLGLSNYFSEDGSLHPTITKRISYGQLTIDTTERAMGGVPIDGNCVAMGILLQNNSGAPIENLKVSYTGEQWHFGGTSLTSTIVFSYKISSNLITDLAPGNNTGWVTVHSLDFTSPIAYEDNPCKLDGNLSANRSVFSNINIPDLNIPENNYIMLRWSYADQNAPHGLAIDDVQISWIGNTVISGGNWNEPLNWNWGMPDTNINAVINGNVIADVNGSCFNLIINSGKSLTINNGITLSVNNFQIKSSSAGVGSYINNGTLNITGSPIVEMYVPGTSVHNGIFFSPPLNSLSAPSISDSVYRYNASTNQFVLVYNNLITGTGYTIRSDTAITKKLIGSSLNNSNVYIGNLVRQSNPNNFGWNLVGNPYVCGLDWEYLNDMPANYTNLINGFYVRTSDGSAISYVNGVGNPTGTSSIIPPFQAFYVQVQTGHTTGNLNIPLSARTHNTQNLFKNEIPVIRMQITSSEGNSDETVLRIEDNATDKFDNEYDGNKMFADNNYPQIFSMTSENDALCINAISVSDNKIVSIPIGFQAFYSGDYTFNIFDYAQVDTTISIFLKDTQNNTIQDLRKNPVYNFNTSPGMDTERFMLILSKQNSGTFNNNNPSEVLINSVNKSIIINLQSENNANVEVFNVLGEQVLSKTLNNSSYHKIDLSVKAGIYIVKVMMNNYTIARKVLIN